MAVPREAQLGGSLAGQQASPLVDPGRSRAAIWPDEAVPEVSPLGDQKSVREAGAGGVGRPSESLELQNGRPHDALWALTAASWAFPSSQGCALRPR